MKFHIISLAFLLITVSLYGQNEVDYNWWNELHDWKPGDPGWRNYMKISPGYLGPNALPVPEVQKGMFRSVTEIEITASSHYHPEDPTRDISAKLFLPFANDRVAVEMYGVIIEQYNFSEKIRNERVARDRDGEGTAFGDFYFSTLIQVVKDRAFPNTLLLFSARTASGNQLEAARYSDAPGYFTDVSMSKVWGNNLSGRFRPFGLIGFYAWQTNSDLYLQNDALLYAAGADFMYRNWLFSVALSGYSGYIGQRDKPQQLNFDLRKDLNKLAFRLQYLHGLRHWEYQTVKLSFIWKLNPVE